MEWLLYDNDLCHGRVKFLDGKKQNCRYRYVRFKKRQVTFCVDAQSYLYRAFHVRQCIMGNQDKQNQNNAAFCLLQ